MKLFLLVLFFAAHAQTFNPDSFLNLTQVLLKGEDVFDGFLELFNIVDGAIENVQNEISNTSDWRDVNTILNVQKQTFEQIDRSFKEVLEIMDNIEECGQKMCWTFRDETTQIENW